MNIVLKEVLNEALPIIEKFAPNFGNIIGGPVGVASGVALSLLARSFNAHPSDFRSLVANILNDKEAQNKLSSLDKEHGSWLTSLISEIKPPSSVVLSLKMDWDRD